MKVAIIHEWFVNYAGSERVVEQFLKIWPDADIFSVVDFLPEGERSFIKNKPVKTSFIQRLPFAKTRFRLYLPLMPIAVEQFDLAGYDLVISSSHAVSKGVLVGPDQLHISYVHSPIRYAWDLQAQYLRETGLTKGIKSIWARMVLHYLRIWDVRSSTGVDYFIANSKFISGRIRKAYRRDSVVINPPVSLEKFPLRSDKEDFYLVASRMVPYKNIPMIVKAFSKMPGKKLFVIGDGPDSERARKLSSSNITFLGYQEDSVLVDYMQRARAFVFAAEEDFGITLVEAQSCGTPLIAFGRGGVLDIIENVVDGVGDTGVLFYQQSESAIIDAVNKFESLPEFSATKCRENSNRFSSENFREKISDFFHHVNKSY